MKRTTYLGLAAPSVVGLLAVVGLLGCSAGEVGSRQAPSSQPGAVGPDGNPIPGVSTAGNGTVAAAGNVSSGGATAVPAGGATSTAGTGVVASAGSAGTVAPSGTGESPPVVPAECTAAVTPGRAPLRRLTRFEYNQTVADLLGDTTLPGNALPPEVAGDDNVYGNDADHQPVSSFLIEQYGTVAEDIAARATATPDALAALAPCYSTLTADTEATCARSFIESFAPRAYRRPLDATEVEDLVSLFQTVRQTETFESSLSAVIEVVLQSPDFLYRVEFGVADPASPAVLRPSAYEMASRLSYLFWGTMPDATLDSAAAAGELLTADSVLSQATRLLDDPKARPVIRHFFDGYLPINSLTDLTRDAAQYPTFSATIGSLMREETHTFLEYEIFQGPGSWQQALLAPYTFVNETLANYYGIPGVVGDTFQQVNIDTTHRLGLLSQGGIQTGTAITNFTNPVRRGVFLLRNMMCVDLPPPPEELAGVVKPPDPYSGATGRERYSIHAEQVVCAGCHGVMDPPGFGLENYDAVGLWRDTENDVLIDASGTLDPLGGAPFSGPIELIQLIANSQQTQNCFAHNWLTYAYGRAITEEDVCSESKVQVDFTESGYNIKQLLLSLTQTDAFLYLPAQVL